MTFALETLRSKVTLLQLPLTLDTSSIEHGIIERKWKPDEKPPNLIKETGEENRETIENILSP